MSDPTKPPAAPESTPGGAVEMVTVPRFLIEWAAEHHDGVMSESVVRALRAALASAPSLPSQPEAASGAIDIVFDGPPSHESGRFVEVEDANGRGFALGQWVHRPDGLLALRFSRSDLPPEAASAGVREGWQLVPKVALEWLMGETPDHKGRWFVPGDNARGAYWWRSRFTEICAELGASQTPGQPTQDSVSPSKEKGQAG